METDGRQLAQHRIVLGPRCGRVPSARSKSSTRFENVCVFGPHHSCTGAVMREIPRFFEATVLNEHYGDNPPCWKHTVFWQRPSVSDSTLLVCLVKDPAFWIQSLGRDPAEGTFYDVQPIESIALETGEIGILEQVPRSRFQLFRQILFDGMVYGDALVLWEHTVRAYLNERLFPSWQTVIIRSEDFLFNFEHVMAALAAKGLSRRTEDAPATEEPLDSTAKDATHPSCTRRRREELLDYYKEGANRFAGLTASQLRRLRGTAPELLRIFHYGESAPQSWLPAEGD